MTPPSVDSAVLYDHALSFVAKARFLKATELLWVARKLSETSADPFERMMLDAMTLYVDQCITESQSYSTIPLAVKKD